MKAKAFRFGRLSSSQFNDRLEELNGFLSDKNNEILGLPQMTSNDEEGTVVFVYFNQSPPPKQDKKGLSNEKN